MSRSLMAAAAVLVFLAIGSPARAQTQPVTPFPPFPNLFQGTPEEQAACRPDSQRFCADAIPDTFRVLACLQRNRTQISTPCRRVLERHGQ